MNSQTHQILHRRGLFAAVVLALLPWAPAARAATTYAASNLKIMSFNVKTTSHIPLVADGGRPAKFDALMRAYLPDSIGLQEVSKQATAPGTPTGGQSWNAWLNANLGVAGTGLANYASTGKTSDYGTQLLTDTDEYSLILYRKDLYNKIASGGIWIGNNPASGAKADVFTGTGIDAETGNPPKMKHSRVVTWVLLENPSTGFRYLHVNCHPDTKLAGGLGMKQTEVIVKKVHSLAALHDAPVVLTGDFNYVEASNYYRFLTGEMDYNYTSGGLVNATLASAFLGRPTACGYLSPTGVQYPETKVFDPNAGEFLDRVCYLGKSKLESLTNLTLTKCNVTNKQVVWTFTYDGTGYHTNAISDHSPVYAEFDVEYTANAPKTYATGTTPLTIMSLNLLSTADTTIPYVQQWGLGERGNRGEVFSHLMLAKMPDSIGVQESSTSSPYQESWNAWFSLALGSPHIPDYDIAGKLSDYGTALHGDLAEYCPIIYNKVRYLLVDSGGIWIGSDPKSSALGSVFSGTNAANEPVSMHHSRVVAWVLLRNKETGFSYLHVNTQLDTRVAGQIGERQTEVVVNQIKLLTQKFKVPVVLTGDFNYDDFNPPGPTGPTWTKYYNYLTGVSSYNSAYSGLADARYEVSPASTEGTHRGYGTAFVAGDSTIIDRVCFMDPNPIPANDPGLVTGAGLTNYSCTVAAASVITSFSDWMGLWETKNLSDHSPVHAQMTISYTK